MWCNILLNIMVHMKKISRVINLDLDANTRLQNLRNYKNCENLLICRSQDSPITIDECFLENFTNLKTIKFEGQLNVTSVGHSFLKGCTALQSITFEGLSNVKFIRSGFLEGCTALQTIDFKGLSNVTSIDSFFLRGCTALQMIDFTGLFNVTSVGNKFLDGCKGFKTIDFQSGVNYTAGLPIVRTSPDHGTAYDLAGKNLADDSSFREALYRGLDILKNRQETKA